MTMQWRLIETTALNESPICLRHLSNAEEHVRTGSRQIRNGGDYVCLRQTGAEGKGGVCRHEGLDQGPVGKICRAENLIKFISLGLKAKRTRSDAGDSLLQG